MLWRGRCIVGGGEWQSEPQVVVLVVILVCTIPPSGPCHVSCAGEESCVGSTNAYMDVFDTTTS